MQSDRDREIERGMRLAADLPEVMPDQADVRLQPIYKDIQRSLRVPFINLVFRVLANYPDYFERVWQQLGPVVRTRDFEYTADGLRAQALLGSPPEMVLDRDRIEGLDQLRAFNDTIHYVLPKLLLIATTLDVQTIKRSPDGAGRISGVGETIALGIAEGTTKVQMLDPAKADGRISDLFERVKQRHGHPLVSSYYRGLGNWPEVLEAAWSRIEPIVGSEAYETRKREVLREAEAWAVALPHGAERPEETEIRASLAAFRFKFIPEMLLDVALVKAMLDGPEAAHVSRFSAAGAA